MRTAYLADSNILLRSLQSDTLQYAQVHHAIDTLFERDDDILIMPQCLIEFWGVATRPAENRGGLGLTTEVVQQELHRMKRVFLLKSDTADIFPAWEQIVSTFGVQGKQVHDARLVAAMQVHGITHILTFNTADFLRYQPLGITVVHPADI